MAHDVGWCQVVVAVVWGGAAAGATGPAAAATCPLADWQWTNTFISHHTPHTPHSTGYTHPTHRTLARVCPGLASAVWRLQWPSPDQWSSLGEQEAPPRPRPPPGETRWNFPWRNISWQIVIKWKYFYPPPHQQWGNNSDHKLQVKRLMKINWNLLHLVWWLSGLLFQNWNGRQYINCLQISVQSYNHCLQSNTRQPNIIKYHLF